MQGHGSPATGGSGLPLGMDGNGMPSMQGLAMSPAGMSSMAMMGQPAASLHQQRAAAAYSSGGQTTMTPFNTAAYGGGTPMSAPPAPGAPQQQQQRRHSAQQQQGQTQAQQTQQQQRLIQLQLQQQQLQLQQLHQHQQQAAISADAAAVAAQAQAQQSQFNQQYQFQQQQQTQQQQQKPKQEASQQRKQSLMSSSTKNSLHKASSSAMQNYSIPSHQKISVDIQSSKSTATSGNGISVPTSKRNDSSIGSTSTTNIGSQTTAKVSLTPDQINLLLSQCNAGDRTIYLSKQLLGGSTMNGFLRATAAAQRIKKQRARQVATAKSKAGASNTNSGTDSAAEPGTAVGIGRSTTGIGSAAPIASTGNESNSTSSSSKRKGNDLQTDQSAEERIKKETMNVRTAKKIKHELTLGVNFVAKLHTQVVSILRELDPSATLPKSLPAINVPNSDVSSSSAAKAMLSANARLAALNASHAKAAAAAAAATKATSQKNASNSKNSKGELSYAAAVSGSTSGNVFPSSQSSLPSLQGISVSNSNKPIKGIPLTTQSTPAAAGGGKTSASPGDPSGSTLRRLRKRRYSAQNTIPNIPEYDSSGKRLCSKKEHGHRILQILRFRALKKGDYVAARVSSRDLWILSRVIKDYASLDMSHEDFIQLSEAKRDSLFRQKVAVKDVEEKDVSNTTLVERKHVLPLPRTYAEAAEWGARCKKSSRVYAMYPTTTSLYPATVIDNTTYCRGEDDIIVVEFDGDEPDVTGGLPQYHIPARFVTLIPREFPSSEIMKKKRGNVSTANVTAGGQNKRSNTPKSNGKDEDTDDALDGMISEMAYGAFASTSGLDNFQQFEMDELSSGAGGANT